MLGGLLGCDGGCLMETIRQKHSTDCGIACVAMLVGKKYNEVEERMKTLKCIWGRKRRTDWDDIVKTLKSYDKRLSRAYEITLRNKLSWESIKKNAIVAINYSKKNGYWHWVVFDKERCAVRDPQSEADLESAPEDRLRNITDKRMRLHMYKRIYD